MQQQVLHGNTGAEAGAMAEAPSFGDVVGARFRIETASTEPARAKLEDAFHELLALFSSARGPVLESWFGFRSRSAVMLTDVDRAAKDLVPALHIGTAGVPLHPTIDAALREVTTIQFSSMLTISGTSRLIASQRAYMLAASLLGVAESRGSDPRGARTSGIEGEVERIRPEIENLQEYVTQAASRAATIRYLAGVVSALAAALLAVGAAVATGVVLSDHAAVVAALSGAVGATVSALGRQGRLRGPAEPLLRLLVPLGATRVIVGAVFGFAGFLLIDSGLVSIQPTNGNLTSFYAVIGFIAGFAERLTRGVAIVGSAENANEARLGPKMWQSTARLLDAVPARVEASVNEALTDAIHGPPLANFRGFAWATIEADRVVVSIGPKPPPDTTAAEVSIETGIDLPEVEFTVQLDSDQPGLRSPQQLLRVSADGPPVSVTFAIIVETLSEGAGLWVRVTQRGRLVQIFELQRPA